MFISPPTISFFRLDQLFIQPASAYCNFLSRYLKHLLAQTNQPWLKQRLNASLAVFWLLYLLYPHQVNQPPSLARVIRHPQNAATHSQLAKYFSTLGYPQLAIRELQTSSHLNPPASAIYTHQIQKLKQISTAPITLRQEILSLINWPNTRDKYLELALKFHQLGLDAISRHYLSLAKNLDPNYPEIRKLTDLINHSTTP